MLLRCMAWRGCMQRPNRLAGEKSPYLLQHAYNPVDWYPWGEEAFRKAREENKPIFLSIGYSSCHWCHVMERESFNDKQIAQLLNTFFVPVKVDREERPDVDEVYMKAVMVMTGHGGWPLTVILTPDLKPFFGGTYFPPRRRGGIRGLDEILKAVAEIWRKDPEGVRNAAEQTVSILKSLYTPAPTDGEVGYSAVTLAYDTLVTSYDELHGGFGTAPKFPMPTYIEFLHTYYVLEGERAALKMAVHTLEKMAMGGLRDQVGGGFFRYSTDRVWLVPHFEKMLYDNALLSRVYLQAYLLTDNEFFKDVAVSTLDWMLREIYHPGGGFYSAVDADSPEGEGAFYVWRKKEVYEALGGELAELACKAYGITDAGNFEHGRSIPTMAKTVEALAAETGLEPATVKSRLEEARRRLYEVRSKRPAPAVDDKIITGWNGLAISALCQAYQVVGDPGYLVAAEETTHMLLSGGGLRRYFRDGWHGEAFLDDYAYLVNGLLDIFQTTFKPLYLEKAVELAEEMIELFWDGVAGGFFYSRGDVAGISRIKEAYDGVTPSGNSSAAWALLRLYELTAKQDYLDKVHSLLKAFAANISNHPAEYTGLLQTLAYTVKPRMEIVIACRTFEESKPFFQLINKRYMPLKTVLVVTDENRQELEKITELVKDKTPVNGSAAVYVCENYTCRMPATSVEELERILR
jgi:uncharacterized protein YyaL (SSP411 family)